MPGRRNKKAPFMTVLEIGLVFAILVLLTGTILLALVP